MRGHGGGPRRLRSASVRLGAVAALALTFIPACSSDETDEVCVDESNQVVEDYYCDDDYDDDDGHSYHHYYVPRGSKPRVGEYASGGSSNKSSVTRNGYGSSYRGGSSGS